jgi:hypothetical protein
MLNFEELKTAISDAFTCPISLSINLATPHFYNNGHTMTNYCGPALLGYMRKAPGVAAPHLNVSDEDLRKVRDVMSQEDYWAKAAFIIFARGNLINEESLSYKEEALAVAKQALTQLIAPEKDHGLPPYYESICKLNTPEFGISPLFLQPYIKESGSNTLENRLIVLPVVASDGATYDLATYILALESNWHSPITNAPFEKKSVRISRAMSILLNAYLDLALAFGDPAGICANRDDLIAIIRSKIQRLYNEAKINNYVVKLNQLIKHNDQQCPLCQQQAQLKQIGSYCQISSRCIVYPGMAVGLVGLPTASEYYPAIAQCLPSILRATVALWLCGIGCIIIGFALMQYGGAMAHNADHKGVVPNMGWRGEDETPKIISPYRMLHSILIGNQGVVTSQPAAQVM